MNVCTAIERVLLPLVIKFSNMQEVINGFECLKFPNYNRVFDETHVNYLLSLLATPLELNRKGHFSRVMQGLVDHQHPFPDGLLHARPLETREIIQIVAIPILATITAIIKYYFSLRFLNFGIPFFTQFPVWGDHGDGKAV